MAPMIGNCLTIKNKNLVSILDRRKAMSHDEHGPTNNSFRNGILD
eukprot:CAMPEP_0204621722 /NCGR_PEP_ID=MMETSP0717-20131115/7347_1 /ASSEMBLY_ACC=CAM_ASM_000666 /TAXON_ID=230516 /ORGANISM="Chaetoceros curvisetus" /LENGTH=44 /DNA_ID= /DNA_START= /DNA_END= /DNA_ORIENTATION=